jgi:hypothetical protein
MNPEAELVEGQRKVRRAQQSAPTTIRRLNVSQQQQQQKHGHPGTKPKKKKK